MSTFICEDGYTLDVPSFMFSNDRSAFLTKFACLHPRCSLHYMFYILGNDGSY